MIFIKKIVLIMNVCCKVNYVKLFAMVLAGHTETCFNCHLDGIIILHTTYNHCPIRTRRCFDIRTTSF